MKERYLKMDKFIKEIGKLYVQDGFIQGLESMLKQIKKLEQNPVLKELPADVAFCELRQQLEKTIADLKPISEKQWKEFEAEQAKGKK